MIRNASRKRAGDYSNDAAHVRQYAEQPGTLVAPQIGGLDAPEARITWGDPSTPLSHCRVYVNAASSAAAAIALEANTATEIIMPGTALIVPGIKIFTLAIVGVYRESTVDGTDPAPIANGAGTRVFGCIPDTLDYGGGGTEVADRTIFWDFVANASSGVDVAKIILPSAEYNADATATDSPPVALVRCSGYTF